MNGSFSISTTSLHSLIIQSNLCRLSARSFFYYSYFYENIPFFLYIHYNHILHKYAMRFFRQNRKRILHSLPVRFFTPAVYITLYFIYQIYKSSFFFSSSRISNALNFIGISYVSSALCCGSHTCA